MQLIAEAHVQLEKWREALNAAKRVLNVCKKTEDRITTSQMISHCLMELEMYPELIQWLPKLKRIGAQYSIQMNIALIEAADNLVEEGKLDIALILYRRVYSKNSLIQHVQGQLDQARETVQRMGKRGVDMVAFRDKQRQLKVWIHKLDTELKQLQSYPDYEVELFLRTANCYFELQRNWEALQLFDYVVMNHPESEFAQQALYASFSTSIHMGLIDRALGYGEQYMRTYPKEDFFDQITLTMAQLHLDRKAYSNVVQLVDRVLKIQSSHSLKDQLLYLAGYAEFQDEHVEEALTYFTRCIGEHPKSSFRAAVDYWQAMCYLFSGDYEKAFEAFETFEKKHASSPFSEDAMYRKAIAIYGEGDFEKAAELLSTFIEAYSQSPLLPEALNMLGDIQGSWGALDDAMASYQQAWESTFDMKQIDYATFQALRVLEAEARWDEIIALLERYKNTHGRSANVTQAAYWIATAHTRANRPQQAEQVMFDAIVTHGDDAKNDGIDMMIRDLIYEFQNKGFSETRQEFIARLHDEMDKAMKRKQFCLWMRLITLFAEVTPDKRSQLAERLLEERYLEIAPPIALAFMGQEATKRGQKDFARKVYEHFVAEYIDSGLAITALRGLAELEMTERKYEEAIPLLERISLRYASLPEAGWAKRSMGDIFFDRKQYHEAIETYNYILAMKEWRGDLWPEALYKIGLCHLKQGKATESFAFFQRVYVMYEGYPEWAAKAYLKSGEALEKLNRKQEAINTYREMIQNATIYNGSSGEIP